MQYHFIKKCNDFYYIILTNTVLRTEENYKKDTKLPGVFLLLAIGIAIFVILKTA